MKLLSTQVLQVPCYLAPLRPKYQPQRLILLHSQPTFLLQYRRPSFTFIKSRTKLYYCELEIVNSQAVYLYPTPY